MATEASILPRGGREEARVQVINPTPNAETLPRRELARILFPEPYLAAFRERLPRYPYATDDPRKAAR